MFWVTNCKTILFKFNESFKITYFSLRNIDKQHSINSAQINSISKKSSFSQSKCTVKTQIFTNPKSCLFFYLFYFLIFYPFPYPFLSPLHNCAKYQHHKIFFISLEKSQNCLFYIFRRCK